MQNWTNNRNIEITNYPVDDLIFAEYNPRQLTTEQYKNLKDSITRFGLVDPLIININLDRKNILIGGHQRARIAKDMGIEEVPCVEVDLTYDQERELNIRLNKNVGEWDYDTLANNFDVESLLEWGFTEDELQFNQTEDEIQGLIDDDEIPEVGESISKSGDLWVLGDHRLLCGDATKKENVGHLMDGQKADMVFTDPPYGISYQATEFEIIEGDKLRGEELYNLIYKSCLNFRDYTKENPALYMWHASGSQMIFETALNDAGFEIKEQIIWNKGMVLGYSDYHWAHEPMFYARKKGSNNDWYGDRKHKTILRQDKLELNKFKKDELIQMIQAMLDDTTVWEIKKDSVKKYLHPTQKPVDLCIKAAINNTKREMLVADYFIGSGSTLIACEKTGRKCYGMEIDPPYCDVAVKRWEEFTGRKAELKREPGDNSNG